MGWWDPGRDHLNRAILHLQNFINALYMRIISSTFRLQNAIYPHLEKQVQVNTACYNLIIIVVVCSVNQRTSRQHQTSNINKQRTRKI